MWLHSSTLWCKTVGFRNNAPTHQRPPLRPPMTSECLFLPPPQPSNGPFHGICWWWDIWIIPPVIHQTWAQCHREKLYPALLQHIPGFGCMLGISGGILGDFSSGCGLFPKIPGFGFVDMEGSSGGGDLKGWSHRIKNTQTSKTANNTFFILRRTITLNISLNMTAKQSVVQTRCIPVH